MNFLLWTTKCLVNFKSFPNSAFATQWLQWAFVFMGLREGWRESLAGAPLHKADTPIPCPIQIQHPLSLSQLEVEEWNFLGGGQNILKDSSYSKANVCKSCVLQTEFIVPSGLKQPQTIFRVIVCWQSNSALTEANKQSEIISRIYHEPRLERSPAKDLKNLKSQEEGGLV